ncbi:unnamed protein product [Alopecurus aequalis]
MYVTRRLSQYLADPKAAAEPPPEGPGSGFLVVVDAAGKMRGLPFPQNCQLVLENSSCCSGPVATGALCVCCCLLATAAILSGSSVVPPVGTARAPPDSVMLVPVVGQPLASGRYYVVRANGQHMGKVSVCSKEEDKTTCCFGSCISDLQPCFFERGDDYQQVEVQRLPSGKGFTAVAVATDGIPPRNLRKKGWEVSTMASTNYDLADDAQGVDCSLRRRMPDLDSLNITARGSPPVVVGRWYVPFMFVKADSMFVNPDRCFVKSDGKINLKDQSERCMFYKMTMEQSWEQIYFREAENTNHAGSKPGEVAVTATVRRSTAVLQDGTSVVPQEDGGAVWFRPAADTRATVGLDIVVWERMKWELERGGWVARGNGVDEERIERVEKRDDGLGQWHKFGCYVLVETFALNRMDGSPVLTCEFRHTDKIRAKWL